MSDIKNRTRYPETHRSSKGKILIVGPLPPTVGGITRFIKDLVTSDLNSEYELAVFGTERPSARTTRDLIGYTLISRLGLVLLAESAITTMSHVLRFPIVLMVSRPNAVHINTASYWSFWENSVYSLISRLFRRKVIFHIHGGGFRKFYEGSNIFGRFLIRKALDIPDKIIVVSPKWKNLLMEMTGKRAGPEEKIVAVENCVDSSIFAHFKKEKTGETINVLFVGGVEAKAKGMNDVLKAIPLVVKQCENVSFCFVACGNVGGILKTKSGKTYASHAEFLDYVFGEEKARVFANADIFILPSYFEGLPITMLEAMAAGLPVIATPVGAIPEVVKEGENGFFVNVGDYRALAEKILMLAADKGLRLRMATCNIEKIRKQYDKSTVMRKLGSVYNQILD